MRPIGGGAAHGAGPRGGIEQTAVQVARAKPPTRIADGFDLGVGGWVIAHNDAAGAKPDHHIIFDDDCAIGLIAAGDSELAHLLGVAGKCAWGAGTGLGNGRRAGRRGCNW